MTSSGGGGGGSAGGSAERVPLIRSVVDEIGPVVGAITRDVLSSPDLQISADEVRDLSDVTQQYVELQRDLALLDARHREMQRWDRLVRKDIAELERTKERLQRWSGNGLMINVAVFIAAMLAVLISVLLVHSRV